jgi:hypothetical protein
MFDDERSDDHPYFGDDIRKKIKTTQQRMREVAVREFVDGCYAVYSMLHVRGVEALEDGDPDAIEMAINRMMALFLHREEYERCAFIKSFVEKHIPDFEIQPDWRVIEDMEEVKSLSNGTKS